MRTELSLNGTWELAGFDPGKGDWARVRKPYPIPAPVPGEVHPALQAAGVIEDPFVGTNAEQVGWVEQKEWWYRRAFTPAPESLRTSAFLEFDGLDTFGDVSLNGEKLGSVGNMFVPHRFDVTGVLRAGENTVEVRFQPVVKVLEGTDLGGLSARYNPVRVGARKMQASFGWDWCPKLLGAGIWRDVRLVCCDRLSISEIHIQPELGDRRGEAWIAVAVENHWDRPVDAIVRITVTRAEAHETIELQETVSSAGDRVEALITVVDPELWWPNELGEQPLYTAAVELLVEGELLDRREQRFAFRTMELRERDDEGRPAFFFAINGRPVYVRGANWIPPDAFPSRITAERYHELLTLARDAHMNMLRVWGGGTYERREFYDLCDEFGLLVWQDFMFSLAEYPETDSFLALVEQEAEEVVRRLRRHPSVALWCGNNECAMDVPVSQSWRGSRIFHELLPRITRALDGTRPYWPSSPYGGPEPRSGEFGDYHGEPWFHTASSDPHLWHEWIEKDKGLFVSETPTQGVPEVESLRRFLPEKQLWPPRGTAWELHAANNEHRQGRLHLTSLQALVENTRELAGEPRSVEEFARLGGVVQGHFLKSQINYYRRHKFAIGGVMFWMFDDAWPAVDYSVVDWYLRPKPAYWFVTRAYAPVALVLDREEDEIGVWVVNDSHEAVEVEAQVGVLATRETGAHLESLPVQAAANSVQRISSLTVKDPREQVAVGRLLREGAVISRDYYYDALIREMHFARPKLHSERWWQEDGLHLRVAAGAYVPAVGIFGLPDLARPDDNYFPLLPGEPREAVVRKVSEVEAEGVRVEVVL